MKSLLVLLALTLTTSAFARGDKDGRLNVNSGDTIIRIEVGNERENDSRAMMRRMVQLERAVRELQNRVYDLEDDARPQTREQKIVTCALKTSFDGTFIGKATTQIEAQSIAIQQCERAARFANFCDEQLSQTLRCEESIEIVRN